MLRGNFQVASKVAAQVRSVKPEMLSHLLLGHPQPPHSTPDPPGSVRVVNAILGHPSLHGPVIKSYHNMFGGALDELQDGVQV